MSRKRKYKAFDKVKKCWIRNFYITPNGNILTVGYSEYGEPFTDISNMVELVELTGLQDKNGKDIYEGDIVKVKTDLYREYIPNINFESVKQVIWRKEHFTYGLETKEETDWYNNGSNIYRHSNQEEPYNVYFLTDIQSYEIEVIGNIYENPELLGGKDDN